MPEEENQDIQYEDALKKAMEEIPLLAKDWTGSLPSDPGVTILENLTAFTLLLTKESEKMPEEAQKNLFALFGITPRRPQAAYVLLEPEQKGKNRHFLARERFSLGGQCFETEQETEVSGASLTAVVRTKDYKMHLIWERGQESFPAFPVFGEYPSAGTRLYLVFDRPCAKPGQTALLYVGVKEAFQRPGSPEEYPVFARVRWSYSTESGFEGMEVRDGTGGFVHSGEIRLKMGEKAHRADGVRGQWGYILRCELSHQEYDAAPVVDQIAGPLFSVRQTDTQILSVRMTASPVISLSFPCEREWLLYVYAGSEEDGYMLLDEYRAGESADADEPGGEAGNDAPAGGRLRVNLKGCQDAALRVVRMTPEAAVHSLLGEVLGYDGEEFPVSAGEEQLQDICPDMLEIAAEVETPSGDRTWFFRPEDNSPGALCYVYIRERRAIRILDAGDFEGSRIRLTGCALSGGTSGNVLAHNHFQRERSRETYLNPARGYGGCRGEGLTELRQRWEEMSLESGSLVTERDYERAVREIPGLGIHKVQAIRDPGAGQVIVYVKPYPKEGRPRLPERYRERIEERLDARRLLGSAFEVRGAGYVPVSVFARITVKVQYADVRAEIEQAVRSALDQAGSGCGFGTPVSHRGILEKIKGLPCVESVEELFLRAGEDKVRSRGRDLIVPPGVLCYAGDVRLELKRSRVI